MHEHIETVIIGGGHAGLTLSRFLTQCDHEHVILERGRLAERWRSERWDSLTLLTPNWASTLPGARHPGNEPNGFASRDDVVRYFEAYATAFAAPVRCGVTVTGVRAQPGRRRFVVETRDGTVEAANVVVATGPFQLPALPAAAAQTPSDVVQLHSSQYRNPAELPPGGVLVVGSGSSGFQIAEELSEAGRPAYLSVGRHLAPPRRYRGHDTVWWGVTSGLFGRTIESLPSPAAQPPSPALTGTRGGHDLDLHHLASLGVSLLGHTRGFRDKRLVLAADLAETVRASEAALAGLKRQIDAYVQRVGLEVPDEAESIEVAALQRWVAEPTLELDLERAGVTSVIWCSGFRNDFGWLRLPAFDPSGEPLHQRGVTGVPGLYFLGLRWLHRWKSSFIMGAEEDAAYLAEQLVASQVRAA